MNPASNKTPCQESFEVETSDWGLNFERDEAGCYVEYQTGIMFGAFRLGWESHERKMENNG